MREDPSQTIDISNYGSVQNGEIEIYTDSPGSIGRLLGSSENVKKFRVYAEREGQGFTEERSHTIEGSHSGVKEYLNVERQESSTDLDPRVLESMHPRVRLGGPHKESEINLDLRDPTALIPREDRVEDDREIFLRTYKGTGHGGDYFDGDNEQPNVQARISEGEGSTTYVLETGPSSLHNKARIKGTDKQEHLNDVLETIEVPDLDDLVEQANHPTSRV